MRKYIIIAALALASLSAYGQTVEFVTGTSQRVFIEKTAAAENYTTFAYLEATYNGGAMLKVFHEQKFWKAPLFIHGEYQTTFDNNHVALAGLTWSFGLPNGFISFTPQYRYDFGANLHGAQFSNAYLAAWKWVELYGYNHYWYNGSHCFFGEERIHFRITDHFKIGGLFDLTYFGRFDITPYLGLRFDF
jgi:hypothetical protein